MADPFETLGLTRRATSDEIRHARRTLAKQHHPDTGGDVDQMRTLNEAAEAALRIVAQAAHSADPSTGSQARPPADEDRRTAGDARDAGDVGLTTDVPSFTVEALPVETFEALLVVTTWIGELIDDDPPYRLDVLLHANATLAEPCWCRLELVPDAGASTVSIGIGPYDERRCPSITAVRDLWIAQLNRYDWTSPDEPA